MTDFSGYTNHATWLIGLHVDNSLEAKQSQIWLLQCAVFVTPKLVENWVRDNWEKLGADPREDVNQILENADFSQLADMWEQYRKSIFEPRIECAPAPA